MLKIIEDALTFDDVLLVPNYSEVLPSDVLLKTKITRDIELNIPLVSAAMDTVTDAQLAVAIAQEGGIGIIHKNMTIEQQAEQVKIVKKYESGIIKDPICIVAHATVADLKILTKKHNISGVPVIEDNNLVGIVTSRDVRFVSDLKKPVSSVMTPKERLITVLENETQEEVKRLLHKHRIEKVLVVDKRFRLKGMITVKDMQKAQQNPISSKDTNGHLLVGAALGVAKDTLERAAALVKAGVDILNIDTAHGHSKGVLSYIKQIKTKYPDVQVIGGNIATEAAAKDLIKAGVDGIKVGIGPGSICTTRIVTGIGVPQITAIANVCKEATKAKIPVIADGGIRFSGDIAKALAAGANVVMLGSMFAGTDEAPGEIELYQGRSYKGYRGMGSLGAMSQQSGSSDRYFQANESNTDKLVPEGIEGRVPCKGPLTKIVHQLLGGLRAAMGYTGSKDIDALRTKATFVKVTNAGMTESHVHDVTITKEAPNYQTIS
jgi:IMP dehydrogenase